MSALALLKPTIRTSLMRPFRAYERSVHRYPIATKFVVGGALGGAGDLIVQWNKENLDTRRLTSFVFFNAIFSSGPNHLWFQWLETSAKTVARKLALQHLFFNPVVYIPAFYFIFGSMIGNHPSASLAKLQQEGLRTYSMLLATWIPVSIFQFNFIPVAHQVLFVAGVNVGWNAILSCATSESSTNASGEAIDEASIANEADADTRMIQETFLSVDSDSVVRDDQM